MRLYRLSGEAQHLVTPELARGSPAWHPSTAYEAYLEELEAPLDLDPLDAVLDDLLASTRPHDASFDPIAAPVIHRALPLSRREAALPGVWRYLAVVHRPDVVRHRWHDQSWATTRSRYWSLGTRHDSNAFSRLWWIAELTREEHSYGLTRDVLDRQSLATQVFVRQFSAYRPAVAAFVRVMKNAASQDIERVAKELNGRLSTLVLESLDDQRLEGLVRELADARD